MVDAMIRPAMSEDLRTAIKQDILVYINEVLLRREVLSME